MICKTVATRATQPVTATKNCVSRILILILVCVPLSACDKRGPDTAFEEYLERLERSLATKAAPFSKTALPRPPRSGTLRITPAASKVDVLDFLALSGCELQTNIGRRNSSLGRLARDSQRLLLDLEFLRLAPACIDTLRAEDRSALADELQKAWELKRAQLPAMIFNATLGSDEFRAFWLPTRQMGVNPPVGDSSVVTSLGAINAMTERWLTGDYRANNQNFELALGDISGGGGGALMQALVRQHDWLLVADEVLEKRLKKGPLCADNVRHSSADILPNVVRQFFIGGIQPSAAVMENRRYALFPRIKALEQQISTVLPEDYRTWQQARDELLTLASGAPRRHVGALQRIQEPCGEG